MLEEHQLLQSWGRSWPKWIRTRPVATIPTKAGDEPILFFSIGNPSPDAPVLGLFAGVHGIEAIGVKILMAFLHHLMAQLPWNRSLQNTLKQIRIEGIPIVNPAGYVAHSRCNGNGVDLMRNSPVESHSPTWLVGGQKYSPKWPWFQGHGWELESKILVHMVQETQKTAPFYLTIDFHSGFGIEDSLWTPWAHSPEDPPQWNHYLKLSNTLDHVFPHHVYRFGPQSRHYQTHGDLWDHLLLTHMDSPAQGLFLPLTLEVGSWNWIRKSPTKAVRFRNFFNPAHPHREKRTLRRHLPLLNFLLDCTQNHAHIFRNGFSPTEELDFKIEKDTLQ